jgi:PAS domain S-box-containing protein
MNFQYSPYILPLIAAALLSGWVALYSFNQRGLHGARPQGAVSLGVLAIAIAEWCLGYALEIAGADLPTKLLWGKLQYIGIVTVPLMWFFFAINHANRARRLTPRIETLLTVVPAITVLMAFTTELHGLIWKEIGVIQVGSFSALKVTPGIWFWVHSAYSYLMLLAGTVIILRSIGRSKGTFRIQTGLLLVAQFVPWVGNVLYLTHLGPMPFLDPTPFAFALSAIALTLGVYGFRLIDLSPLARDSVIEEMRDGMVVFDQRDLIVDINPAAQRLIGVTAPQAIGQPAGMVFKAWAHLIDRYAHASEMLDEVNLGTEQAPDWFELRLSPLHDTRKHPIGRVLVVRNISRRKAAEERLAQLSRAVEASPVSIVITGTDGKIQYVNPKFSQVTGYTFEETLGQNPRILKTELTEHGVHQQLWATITAGKEWRGEFCNRKKSGELYWESASISPIMGPDGAITHFVAVKEDITARKLAEAELVEAHEQALEASRAKSHLLTRVSHELRTPLGGILGYAELLNNDTFGPLEASQKDAVEQMIDSAYYLDTMVNELLDEAQIEAKTLVLHNNRVSPSGLLKRVESSLAVLAHNRGLAINTHLDPGLPETLKGDEHRLQEILVNLAGNAIKFTTSGEVCVRLLRPEPGQWAIQVSDTGVGITQEAQTYIFDAFRQVDNAITNQNRGTGLGLSITRQLVEMMGGHITLESEPGRGSTFTVYLPLILERETSA